MRDGEIDTPIYRTRKERQARDRKTKRSSYRIYLRQAGILGIATGLSINSLMLSHRMQGTEAMLTSQATTTASFSTVDHFQRWYQGLVDQICSDQEQAQKILATMKGNASQDQLQSDQQQIQQLYNDAQSHNSTIAQAATQDENNAQASPSASLKRVAMWGQDAQQQASLYLGQLAQDKSKAQKIIDDNQKIKCTDAQSDDGVSNHFAVSNFDQLAGGSSAATVNSTVTGAVYGNEAGSSQAPDTVTGATYTVTYETYIAQNKQGHTLLTNLTGTTYQKIQQTAAASVYIQPQLP